MNEDETMNSNNDAIGSGNNNQFQDYFNSLKRFICCRTTALGWQARGYILFSQFLPSAEAGAQYPGTAWFEDSENKYQAGDIYKFPDDPAPAAAPETTPAH